MNSSTGSASGAARSAPWSSSCSTRRATAGDGSTIDEGLAVIREYLRHRHGGTRQELAVDYARVFLGAGSYDRILAPPYESVFTSEERILMQDARDGAVSYYRRGGLDLPAEIGRAHV